MKSFPLCILVVGLYFASAYGIGHCPNGTPLISHNCGRGGSRCPDGYFCNIAPNDAYAECCPTSQCPNGAPLLGNDGNAVYCGRGGVQCPNLYQCKIAANDAYAVCCLE